MQGRYLEVASKAYDYNSPLLAAEPFVSSGRHDQLDVQNDNVIDDIVVKFPELARSPTAFFDRMHPLWCLRNIIAAERNVEARQVMSMEFLVTLAKDALTPDYPKENMLLQLRCDPR